MELKIELSNRRTIAGLIILVCAIMLVFYLPGLIVQTNPDVCMANGECQHEQRLNLLIELVPVFIIGGIAIGAIVFYFMTVKLDDKKKELEKISTAFIQFLNKDEKKILQKILEGGGKVYQSEISRIEGIGKLKSHRILRRLEDRGAIEIEKAGKTNIVKLPKHIKDVLVK
ncbi:MAG: hypothetical protein V1493_06485 [Candidatus Diapherotrites archaeon]